jgi:4-amino-4-deoxy-L-arabinose transferase-like glycosyltransferase
LLYDLGQWQIGQTIELTICQSKRLIAANTNWMNNGENRPWLFMLLLLLLLPLFLLLLLLLTCRICNYNQERMDQAWQRLLYSVHFVCGSKRKEQQVVRFVDHQVCQYQRYLVPKN